MAISSWPKVRDVDPLELGVHRAPLHSGSAVPAYIRRDTDDALQFALREAQSSGGFLLLIGDSTAGKSRSAYQGLLEEVPDWKIFYPSDSAELGGSALSILTQDEPCVIWLDDLERFVGTGGLSPTVINHFKRANKIMMATIRGEQYARLLKNTVDHSHANAHTGSESTHFQKILDQSVVLLLPRLWTATELERAKQSTDTRIKYATQQSETFGVAEYLAAGPRLREEWQAAWGVGTNPRGASLVAAAVDCARAGIVRSVSKAFLTTLHEVHLSRAGGSLLTPENVEQAFDWATKRRSGVASPLIPDGAGNYRAFDYLVDHAMREGATPPIDPDVWEHVLTYASQNFSLLSSVALAAYQADMIDTAIRAWTLMAEDGNPTAAISLGKVAENEGNSEEAERWYRMAHDLGDSEGQTYIGLMAERTKDIAGAERSYRIAAGAGDTHGMSHLAMLLKRKGNLTESEKWFRKAATLDTGKNYSAGLAEVLMELGRLDEAEQLYRRAMDGGDADAAVGLGALLNGVGRSAEAIQIWKDGVDRGSADSAAQLALHAEEESKDRAAERWWRKSVALGAEHANVGLAVLLAKSGRHLADAESHFKAAIEHGVRHSQMNFAYFLFEQQRFDEAENIAASISDDDAGAAIFLRSSIAEEENQDPSIFIELLTKSAELGYVPAQGRLGQLLASQQREQEAVEWLTRAAQKGDVQSICELGMVHAKLGATTEASRLFTEAFDAGHAHAACQHGYLLLDAATLDEAAERFEAAYNAGHTHVAREIELIRREQGRGREAANWMRLSKNGKNRDLKKKPKRRERPKRRGR